MKNLVLLSLMLFSAVSFATETQERAAESVVSKLYDTNKQLINPFVTTETCIFGKCSRSIDKQRKNTNKYLDLTSLYSSNLKSKCEAKPQICQLIFMMVSHDRDSLAMLQTLPTYSTKATSENTYKVTVGIPELRSKKIVYNIVCEKECQLDGISTGDK